MEQQERQEIPARTGHPATRGFPESKETGERPAPRAPRAVLDPQVPMEPKAMQVPLGPTVLMANLVAMVIKESEEKLEHLALPVTLVQPVHQEQLV